MSAPALHFSFVQLELPWALGPADGRYVVRGHAGEVEHVLVLRTLGAAPASGGPRLARRRRGRPRAVEPEPPPAAVATTRATVIPSVTLDAPEAWLAAADADAEVARAVAVLNRVLHAHRVAAADPYVREVGRDQAIAVRLGVGVGERVAEGRWDTALEVPPAPPPRRRFALRPQERLAALLGARDAALACEELVLRARADLSAGRLREAALQAEVAVRTAAAELVPWRDRGDLAARIGELTALQPGVAAAAASALAGGLADAEAEAVEHAVGRLEAALRARSAPGF